MKHPQALCLSQDQPAMTHQWLVPRTPQLTEPESLVSVLDGASVSLAICCPRTIVVSVPVAPQEGCDESKGIIFKEGGVLCVAPAKGSKAGSSRERPQLYRRIIDIW